MVQVSKHPLEPKVEGKVEKIFIESVQKVQSLDEVVSFLHDLLTRTEKIMLAKRVAVAFLVIKGELQYREISKILRVSLGTIAKINSVLSLQGGGYRKILTKILKKQAIRQMLFELSDIIKPVPGKGQGLSSFRYEKLKAKRKWDKENPL